jgi:hypothetical protein
MFSLAFFVTARGKNQCIHGHDLRAISNVQCVQSGLFRAAAHKPEALAHVWSVLVGSALNGLPKWNFFVIFSMIVIYTILSLMVGIGRRRKFS